MPDFSDEAEAVPGRVDPVTGSAEGRPTVAGGKPALRATLLARRAALSPASRLAAADRVRAELTGLIRRRGYRRIAGYVPIGGEPGGPGLPAVLHAALPADGELLLPVLRADLDLDWAPYRGPGCLAAGGRGLWEPTGERLGTAAIAMVELVVVPALAVDRRGVRLGRGGGSYDRALARVGPGVLTVALLHDGELVDRVPAEPHDRPVHAVLTPAAGLRVLTSG